jgi:hypothetical protein
MKTDGDDDEKLAMVMECRREQYRKRGGKALVIERDDLLAAPLNKCVC